MISNGSWIIIAYLDLIFPPKKLVKNLQLPQIWGISQVFKIAIAPDLGEIPRSKCHLTVIAPSIEMELSCFPKLFKLSPYLQFPSSLPLKQEAIGKKWRKADQAACSEKQGGTHSVTKCTDRQEGTHPQCDQTNEHTQAGGTHPQSYQTHGHRGGDAPAM